VVREEADKGTEVVITTYNMGNSDYIQGKKFFICGLMVKHWNQLPREVRDCPSPKLN